MARHQRKAPPRHDHPELVMALVEEMTKEGFSSTPDAPVIHEEEQRYGDAVHVTVVWTRWADVAHEQRGAIIMDAYEKAALGDIDMSRVSMALGVTPEEAKDLGLDL